MIVAYYEGLSCPVCSKAFVPDEDIVVCPQCGLPHHRACWKSIGKCYADNKHGTSDQWSRDAVHAEAAAADAAPDANVCPKCGTNNTQYAEFCSRCGCDLSVDDWHSAVASSDAREYAPYRAASNGYGSSETLGGVSTEELAAVVGNNTSYYIPRFQRMNRGQSGGWNWAIFLLSPFWLFYRKQYLLGIICFCVYVLSGVTSAIITASVPVEADLTQMTNIVQAHALFYPWMAVTSIWFAIKVLLAIKGNALYFSHCKKKVCRIKAKTPDITVNELGSYGGVSAGSAILLFSVSEVGVYFVANLILYLLG